MVGKLFFFHFDQKIGFLACILQGNDKMVIKARGRVDVILHISLEKEKSALAQIKIVKSTLTNLAKITK